MGNINTTILNLFKKARIIFWYDENEQLRDEFDKSSIPEVNKLVVTRGVFKIKHRLILEEPKQKFLLYFPYAEPPNRENWLLDVQLANELFRTDKASMYLQELGLDYGYKDFIEKHLPFFESKERKELFKANLQESPSHRSMRYNMLNVTFKSQYPNLENFIQIYAGAFLGGNDGLVKKLQRFNLFHFFWDEIKRSYKYSSESPDIYDFLCKVFESVFSLTVDGGIDAQGKVLLSMWSDTLSQKENFEDISARLAETLNVKSLLLEVDFQSVLTDDLFEVIDKKIVADLASEIIENKIGQTQLEKAVKSRENKYWFYKYKDFYHCLLHAKLLLEKVDQTKNAEFRDCFQGVQLYQDELYLVDFHYRKTLYFYRQTGQNGVLSNLIERISRVYSNDWLLPLGDRWQNVVNATDTWPTADRLSQRLFYKNYVEPVASEKSRLFVVISDAMRYEIGQEMHDRLVRENRFESKLSSMIASIPSYTQLGMASLLPNSQIEIGPGNDSVSVDGVSSTGSKQRDKILKKQYGERSTVIKSDDFVAMSSPDGRTFIKDFDLIYIYHNTIDKTGDDKATEEKLFDAVEQSFVELFDILKKIANVNGNNVLITADHGFIYQYDVLDESDFTSEKITGEKWKENRRFIIGNDLGDSKSLFKMDSMSLGVSNKFEVAFPNSINRLRIKGAGSRFVHGGTSLQEIVIPLLHVTKKRKDTITKVGVDIIKSTDKITSAVLPVRFMQNEPIAQGVVPRKIRAYIQAKDETIISDVFEYLFDLDQENIRQREVKHNFMLNNEASSCNNQSVELKLMEALEGTNRWNPYVEFSYTLGLASSDYLDTW